MKLANPFDHKTRELWRDCWECSWCGCNGQGVGGLELHHITGRDSNSPLNGAVVCKECHAHFGHGKDEEQRLFAETLRRLLAKQYKLSDRDESFMREHPRLIHNNMYLDIVVE